MSYTPPKTKTNVKRFADGTETYIEVVTDTDTTTRTRVYRGVPEIERTNCYCCSCNDTGDGFFTVTDPACRNHGYAAQRPCDLHGMPGQAWGDELGEDNPDYGTMPASVQVKRADDKARYEAWEARQR